MAAAKYRLDNLTVIVDRNRLQISGTTEEVMPLDDLGARYAAFGFDTVACDGNHAASLVPALRHRCPGKPVAVIARTVKGYGSPVMEDKAPWHHAIPNDEQYEIIKRDLTRAMEEAEA